MSEWCQHCDEPIASICQGENAKHVEHVWSVGDGRKQPFKVLFIDTLWEGEEGDDSEKPTGIRAKRSKHWRGEGKFNRGGETPGVMCVKHSSLLSPPFPGQSAGVPLIVLGDGSE